MIKKRIVVLTTLMCMGVSLISCSGKKDDNKKSEITETTTKATENTVQEPDNNPLDIKGYEYYETKNSVNGKDITMVGKIVAGATINEKILHNIFVHKCNDEEVVVEYAIGDDLDLYETHIVNMDATNYEMQNDLKIGEDMSTYTSRVLDGIICNKDSEGSRKIIKYDDKLQEIYQIEMKADDALATGIMSSDGNKMFCAKNGWLMCYDLLKKEESIIEHNYNMYVKYVDSVMTDELGNEHILLTVLMGDLKTYTCILNSSTKEMEYLASSENGYPTVQNDIVVLNVYDEESGTGNSIVTTKNGNTFSYVPKDSMNNENVRVLDNGDICYDSFREGKINIAIYDIDTGDLKGKTSFEVPLKEVTEEGDLDYAFLTQNPVYMNENKVLLSVGDNMQNTLFYVWDLDKADEPSGYDVVSYETSENVIADYNDEVAVSELRKGECSEEFKPLLEVANNLEEKYGVDILIDGEGGRILDVYGLFSLKDYDKVKTSLEYLEEELGRYPDGFFEQFVYDTYKGIDIHICSDIMLLDKEADNLEDAGGLHNSDTEGNIVVAIDCSIDPAEIKVTFHHEMAHAIDKKIEYHMENFEEKWNELNPGDVYMYSYEDYSDKAYDLGLDKYIYDYLYMEDRGDESYFLDNYSLAYPTEDRARIFENLMNKNSWYPDYSEIPLVKDKVNFYANTIREIFDTTGWENVEWERYLID